MAGTAKSSSALYTEVASLIAPNGTGQVTATILAGVINDVIASYPNKTDGLGGYASIGTVTSGAWNGSNIALAYGGTNASLTANLGGIFYSTASAAAILAGTSTAQQMLMSGANAAPSWSTTTWPNTLATSQILYASGTNTVAGLATANNGVLATSASGVPSISQTPTLGVPGSIAGTLSMAGSASGTMTLAANATAGSVTFTFPAAGGNNGQLMQAGGSGVLGWTASTFPSTVAANTVLYASALNTVSALATSANGVLGTNSINVPSITQTPSLGKAGTSIGSLTLNGLTSGSATIGVNTVAGTVTFNLPTTNGTALAPLVGDGAGNLSYGTSITLASGGSVILNGATSGSATVGVKAIAGTTTFTLPVGNGTAGAGLITDGTGVTSWSASNQITPQGRLTLTSATPVLTATVSAAATVYYTPYVGTSIPLWNGSAFTPTVFTELSIATAGTNNAIYDLFVWNNAGTVTLSFGPAWTSSTTRGTGAGTTQLTRVNGLLVNLVALAGGPAAGYGTYVGTISNDSGAATVTWNIGANNTAAVFNVWNAYNRVSSVATVTDTESAYTYTTATARQAGAQTYNNVLFIVGLQEDAISASLATGQTLTAYATTVSFAQVGFGLNSTSAFNGLPQTVCNGSAQILTPVSMSSTAALLPQLGRSTVYLLEKGDGSHANTFNVGTTNTLSLTIRA